jgi:NCS1 family nucleobase:cation symporter-1
MIVDYYFIRKQQLVVDDLYDTNGIYSYLHGFNGCAVAALLIGIAPNVPGFLTTIQVVDGTVFPGWISGLYHYAWFVGFGISGWVYWLLMKNKK